VTTPNPPIKGHTLIGEGHVTPVWGEAWHSPHSHSGGCSCGAKPPEFPNVSTVKMKAWHRLHKEELRATMTDEKLTPERAVRLLRAKGAELEHRVLVEAETLDEPMTTLGTNMLVNGIMADIALIAQLVADHIESTSIKFYLPDEDSTEDIDDANVREYTESQREQFRKGFEEGRQP